MTLNSTKSLSPRVRCVCLRSVVAVVVAYVRDGAFPALYDTCTVVIRVLDVNDNSPVFSDSVYHLFVHENTPLAALYTVIASDVDESNNGEVSYVITSTCAMRDTVDPVTCNVMMVFSQRLLIGWVEGVIQFLVT